MRRSIDAGGFRTGSAELIRAAPASPVVGVDIVSVRRMADVLARHGDRFASRVFTADRDRHSPRLDQTAGTSLRRALCRQGGCVQALRPSTAAPPWRDVEIVRTPGGGSAVSLHGRATELADERGVRDITLSTTHEDEYALAVAVGLAQPMDRSDQ